MPLPEYPQVETSEILFSEVVDAADPGRQRQNAMGHVCYEFGGGRVVKREPVPTYQSE